MTNNKKPSKKQISTILTILILLSGTYLLLNQEKTLKNDLDQLETKQINYNNENNTGNLSVYIADTPDKRRAGLMNVTNLDKDGMIFVYGDSRNRTFWMKNTYIPLYMYFLNSEGETVTRRYAEAPENPAEVNSGSQHTYSSTRRAKYVLELEKKVVEERSLGRDLEVDVSQFQ